MAQPELAEPWYQRAVAGDQSSDDRARAGDGHLLADDRPNAHLERVPGARHAQARERCDPPSQDGIVPERSVRLVRVEVEVEETPDLVDHVDQAAPVRQVGGE